MLTLNRRRFMQTSATGIVLGGAAPLALSIAAGAATSPQAPGFYRFHVGDIELTSLSDGYFHLPSDSIATNVEAAEKKAYFDSHFLPMDNFRLQASPLLINTGSKLVLVDTGIGAGAEWAPSAGRLIDTLAAAGIAPEAIDIVVLTHAHGDHIGGLAAMDAKQFPKAEVVLSDVELDLWTSPDAASKLPKWAAQDVAWQQSTFAALGDRLRPIKAGADVVTGVQSLNTAGHTQGHLSLLIGSGGDQLLVTGDAIAGVHIAFDHPEWQIMWDHDRELGAKTRRALLDRASHDRLLVTGYHYPFPGVGHVVKEGTAYRWIPVDWEWAG